ncbi:tRNA (guanosine(46)-N7)-methyltransferase TrmB [Chromatium okenii]|uniref:tRNA (guanosine(46)-N7)-methyltransferase TrmB n=1 Tax=Chromatium okenii TaxID=61644 RepID=UPI0026F191D9|nr:tRNA (guanosine(46)-N7)-methyltransferase TrmB [Chromatium okenii]
MNSSDYLIELTRRPLRPVRSFVLRQGRLTLAQQRAFAELWSRFGVEWTPAAALNFTALFGNTNPVTLEIGFGNGDSLATMAEREPERNWLGIEVHRPGVGHLLLEIERRQLNNVRIIRHDAIEILTQGIPPASLAAVQLFFPDPWPKRRHHKRRILNAALIEMLAQVIHSGGVFHAATDWESYAIEMLEILEMSAQFVNTAGAGQFAPRPASRPFTRFEQRGDRLGHRVCDLIFQRQ